MYDVLNVGGQTFEDTNAIGLQNYGVSGTVFIASLLDGHPAIAAMPGLGSMGFYDFWERTAGFGDDERLQAFVANHEFWFVREKATMGGLGDDGMDAATVDPERFLDAARTALDPDQPCSRRHFFELVNIAYNVALGRTLSPRVYVLFHIHNMPRATVEKFYTDFPEAKVIHTLRNIPGNFASLSRQFRTRNGETPGFVWKCNLDQLLLNKADYEAGYDAYSDRPHFERYRENCVGLRLEDVHRSPRETLDALCEWLSVPWSETLLESTFDGKPWWNRGRQSSPEVQGFNPKLPYRGISDELSFSDRLRLDIVCCRKARFWRYRNRVHWLPYGLRRALLSFLGLFPTRLGPPRGRQYKIERIILNAYLRDLGETVEKQGNIEVPVLAVGNRHV